MVSDASLLGGKNGLNYSKCITGIWPTLNPCNSAGEAGFPQRECLLNDSCIKIIFMKYKEQIRATTTVNEP